MPASDATDRDRASPTYAPARRWLFLAILFLVGTSSSIDRVVISVLLEPIKHEFRLSDAQLGMMSGFSFALLYSLFGLPIARYADRGDRRLLITVAIGVWSAMTMLCAAAGSFAHLLAARIGVGVGEAGATPPAQSLIVDYFPPEMRARAIGIFTTTGTVGFLVGLSLGARLVTDHGWRFTLIAFGLPGFLIAALAFFLLDEPRRTGRTAIAASQEAFPLSLRRLAGKRAYVRLVTASTVYSFAAYGSLVFVPSYLVRVVKVPIADAGLYYGMTSAFAVLVGSLAGGALCDWLVRRDRRWVAWFPGLGFVLASAPCTLMFLIDDFPAFLLVSTLGGILLYASLPASFAAVHVVCGGVRRATAIALLLFFGNLIGFGLGPWATGWLSDLFSVSHGAAGLRYALMIIMALVLPSGIITLAAARHIIPDMED